MNNNYDFTVCINPATLEKIKEFPIDKVEDFKLKFEKAKNAQYYWAKLSVNERIKKIKKIKKFLLKNIDKICEIISKDNGKTRIDALSTEVIPSILAIDYYCRNAKNFLERTKIKNSSILFFNKESFIEREPYGIIGIISPWNYPFSIPFSEIIMALLAGNVVILKVATETQYVGNILRECIDYADLPDGVFNYVNMPGKEFGDLLIDFGVNKIFFTGSTQTGKYLMEKAAKKLIPLVLELGGKDPMIILEDANLERAANCALWAGLQNAGQSCGGVERIYVHESIYEKFLNIIKPKIENLRTGVDLDFNVDIGAITTKKQLETIKYHLEDALNKGAKIYAQSKLPDNLKGYFFPCIVLVDVNHDMLVMKEETFGPILGIMKFKNIEDAINLANDSNYGLTASIWTNDKKMAYKIAKELKAGTITINDHLMTHGMCETPWGGYKESGIGRTHGKIGFDEMTQPKLIVYDKYSFLPKNIWWFPFSEELYSGLKGIINFLKDYSYKNKISGLFSFIKIIKKYFINK